MNPAQRTGVMAGPPRQSAMWLWACVSAGMHIALFLGFGSLGTGLFAGWGVEDGDGFGGTAIEIEITGAEDGLARGSTSAGSLPSIPAPIPEQRASSSSAESMLEGELPVHAQPAEERASSELEGEDASNAAEDRQGLVPIPQVLPNEGDPRRERVSAPGPAPEPSGTDADESAAGVPAGDPSRLILSAAGALGDSVASRRALLPNGGVCSDPVAGVWRAQKYRASDHTWVRFKLRIRREGDTLTGTIRSRIWSGNPSNPQPGECVLGGFDHTWRMNARGTVDGHRVRFRSNDATLIASHCPSRDTRYAPDNFDGTIAPFSETYQSVNNDGAFDINEPYTFRRVSCQ